MDFQIILSFFRTGFPLSLLILIAAATCGVWLWHFKEQLHLGLISVVLILLYMALFGIVSVHLFAVLEAGTVHTPNKSLFGFVLFEPLAILLAGLVLRKNLPEWFDVLSFCMVFTMLAGRISCVFSGCCYGRLIPGTAGMSYPVRLIEIVFYAWFCNRYGGLIWKKKTHGEVYPLFLMYYGVLRFILQFFRANSTPIWGVFHLPHLWATLAFVIGALWFAGLKLLEARSRRETE